MSARVLNRDNKGRFCSARSEALKSMSLLIDRAKQEIDDEVLIHFLDTFYRVNVSAYNNSTKKRKIKYRISDLFINFTVYWETI